MIRKEVFRELRLLEQIVQNTTAVHEDDTYSYTDICAKWDGECVSNNILELDNIMDEVIKIIKFE